MLGQVIEIDLRQELHRIEDGMKYNISISKWIEKGTTLIFPNTNNHDDKILETGKYTSISKLDHAIEHALQNTKIDASIINTKVDAALKLAVSCNGFRYNIWGVRNEHTYYLYWIDVMTVYNGQGLVSKPLHTLPVLFEYNGNGKMLNMIVFFRSNELLLVEPLDISKIACIALPICNLFTCERIQSRSHSPLETLTSSALGYKICDVTVGGVNDIGFDVEEFSVHDEDDVRTTEQLITLNLTKD